MKKTIATIAMASVLGGSVFAQDLSELSVSGTFAFESEYVFRGSKLTDEAFQPSIEFGMPVYGGDFYVGLWTSMPIADGFPSNQGNEVDPYFGYAYPVTDMFTVDGGFTYYWYPSSIYIAPATVNGAIDRTREFYLGVSADVMLSPAAYVYYDIDLEQWVIEGSIGYDFDLEESMGITSTILSLGAYVGNVSTGNQNAGQTPPVPGVGDPENGYAYYGINADLIYSLSENVDFGLGVRLSGNNDGDTGNSVNGGPGSSDTFFWWGANVNMSY